MFGDSGEKNISSIHSHTQTFIGDGMESETSMAMAKGCERQGNATGSQ